MGRFGWAASVTTLSPAGLWRAPLGDRAAAAPGCCGAARPGPGWRAAPCARPPLRRSAPPPPSPPIPSGSRADAGRELVLGWLDGEGYDGANRAMRTHVFDPSGYPAEVR